MECPVQKPTFEGIVKHKSNSSHKAGHSIENIHYKILKFSLIDGVNQPREVPKGGIRTEFELIAAGINVTGKHTKTFESKCPICQENQQSRRSLSNHLRQGKFI